MGVPGTVLTGQSRVRFRLVSDKTVTADDVYLDDVGIASVVPADHVFLSGTSMAAPHVSGTVALLASLAPFESVGERIGRILSSVDPKDSLSGQCVTGGRLNAAAALASPPPGPAITSLNPASGSTAGGTRVVIAGSGFFGVTAVTFDGIIAGYSVDSPSRITATAPPHPAGPVRVAVTTAAGTPPDTPADDFTYATVVTAPATTRFEQTDSRLVWTGTWTTAASVSCSGGSHRYANVSGAGVTAVFSGTYLAWTAKMSPVYGKAKVTVDGATTYTVDLYSAGTGYKKKVWDTGTLRPGLHTVRIEWTGQRSVSTGGTNISVDAFDVAGTLKSATRFEQTDSRLKWSGTWATGTSTSYSGGSFRYANASGSKVTIDFTGVRLALIAKKAPNYGIARVSVDGGTPVSVDFYSSTTLYKQKVWSTPFLVPGNHTVTITWTGTKRTAATATNINIDAVDVIGGLR